MICEETRYMTDGKPAPSGSPVPVALALLDRWWPETCTSPLSSDLLRRPSALILA
jgi:hypothetical protein